MNNKKIQNPFSKLTKGELILWILSVSAAFISFCLSGDVFNFLASLVGVTALIFLAKGFVIGQVLIIIFSVFYGIISFFFSYYGEMITYIGMTMPMSVAALIEWIRHPYKGSGTVEISRLNKKRIVVMIIGAIGVTALLYLVLAALDTSNLLFSTVSVTTSFLAVYLTYCRSPYYALAYAANDVVLIILWVLASLEDVSYLPMVICFFMFTLNDLYGFFNWLKMQKNQEKSLKS